MKRRRLDLSAINKARAFNAIVISSVTTAIASVIAVSLFHWLARSYNGFYQERTMFAFDPYGVGVYVTVVLCALVGIDSIYRRASAVLPLMLAALISLAFVDGFAYSGPSYLFNAVQPLLELKALLPLLIVLLDGLQVTLIISFLKSARRRANRAPRAPLGAAG